MALEVFPEDGLGGLGESFLSSRLLQAVPNLFIEVFSQILIVIAAILEITLKNR